MPSQAAFIRCVPFGVFVALLIIGSLVPDVSPWLALLRAAVVALLLAWFWPDYRELRQAPPVAAWSPRR